MTGSWRTSTSLNAAMVIKTPKSKFQIAGNHQESQTCKRQTLLHYSITPLLHCSITPSPSVPERYNAFDIALPDQTCQFLRARLQPDAGAILSIHRPAQPDCPICWYSIRTLPDPAR